jgi:integrase
MSAVDLPSMTTEARIEELTFLEPVEVARLVEAAVEGDYGALDRALYVTAAYTGLRQGELRGLKWEHIDFGRSIVHVLENVTRGRRSSPKGKRRRSVPLAPTAAAALLELRASSEWTASSDPVFACPSTGQPMARAGLMARYRKALVAAGLAATFSFHDLRHTFGTTMARQGVPSARSRRGWATPTSRRRSSTCTTRPPTETRRSSTRPSARVPIRVPI